MEWCKACGKVYTRTEYAYLRGRGLPRCQAQGETEEPCGGTTWVANQDGLLVCQDCQAVYTQAEAEKLPKARLCKCGSSSWGSHFAVFPEALVERCILAGTSEHGACPECGAPWERIVQPKDEGPQPSWKGSAFDDGKNLLNHPTVGRRPPRGSGNRERKVAQAGERGRLNTHMGSSIPWTPSETATIGWRPTCAHPDLPPAPCLVLDPFSGAGTVALVAQKLGRRAIGVDLNAKYTALAVKRLEAVALPMAGG